MSSHLFLLFKTPKRYSVPCSGRNSGNIPHLCSRISRLIRRREREREHNCKLEKCWDSCEIRSPAWLFSADGYKNETWAAQMLLVEQTIVLFPEKIAEPSGKTMEPKQNAKMISVPDLLSDPYFPSLDSEVSSLFPYQMMAFLLLISVIPFMTCDYLSKLPHLVCELVYVTHAKSMVWCSAYAEHL